MSYIATTAGVSGEGIRDLITETIESRVGLVDRIPHAIEWLSENGLAYTSRDTRCFAVRMGLVVRRTLIRSSESNGMAEGLVHKDLQAR